ncbi:elongation factor P [Mycoplasmatota bacterium]|nr:elongation factor P [Mycoplasmatota bacterium]
MISCSDLRTGMTIEHEKNIFSVLEYQHVKSARSAAFVRLKLRNLRSGSVVDLTVNSSEKFKPAHIEKHSMQYLYNSGDFYIFMNNETYDQIEIPASNLKNETKFLYEGLEVKVIMFDVEVIGIELPDKVVLEIVECEPAIKGDTAQNATKNAVVQTGLAIQVPLFIENGERVIISTADGKYVSRAK